MWETAPCSSCFSLTGWSSSVSFAASSTSSLALAPGGPLGSELGPPFFLLLWCRSLPPTAIQSHSCSAGKPVSHLGAPSRPHTSHPLTTPACKICPQSDPLPSLPLPALVQATQSLAGPLWSVASQPGSRFLSCLHDHLCFTRKLDTSF